MKQRRFPTKPGTVSKLCVCGQRIGLKSAACRDCWALLPPSLQRAWLAVKDGDSGPALERAEAAIRDHIRKAVAL